MTGLFKLISNAQDTCHLSNSLTQDISAPNFLSQANEDKEGKQLFHGINYADQIVLQNVDDEGQATNEDVDIFVAEIFPEQQKNFEQLFHPLVRYKKAILDMDAQIEPSFTTHKELESSKYNRSNTVKLVNEEDINAKTKNGYQNVNYRMTETGNVFFNESKEHMNSFVDYFGSKSASTRDNESNKLKLKYQKENEFILKDANNKSKQDISQYSDLKHKSNQDNDVYDDQSSGHYSGFEEEGSGHYGSSFNSKETSSSFEKSNSTNVEETKENVTTSPQSEKDNSTKNPMLQERSAFTTPLSTFEAKANLSHVVVSTVANEFSSGGGENDDNEDNIEANFKEEDRTGKFLETVSDEKDILIRSNSSVKNRNKEYELSNSLQKASYEEKFEGRKGKGDDEEDRVEGNTVKNLQKEGVGILAETTNRYNAKEDEKDEEGKTTLPKANESKQVEVKKGDDAEEDGDEVDANAANNIQKEDGGKLAEAKNRYDTEEDEEDEKHKSMAALPKITETRPIEVKKENDAEEEDGDHVEDNATKNLQKEVSGKLAEEQNRYDAEEDEEDEKQKSTSALPKITEAKQIEVKKENEEEEDGDQVEDNTTSNLQKEDGGKLAEAKNRYDTEEDEEDEKHKSTAPLPKANETKQIEVKKENDAEEDGDEVEDDTAKNQQKQVSGKLAEAKNRYDAEEDEEDEKHKSTAALSKTTETKQIEVKKENDAEEDGDQVEDNTTSNLQKEGIRNVVKTTNRYNAKEDEEDVEYKTTANLPKTNEIKQTETNKEANETEQLEKKKKDEGKEIEVQEEDKIVQSPQKTMEDDVLKAKVSKNNEQKLSKEEAARKLFLSTVQMKHYTANENQNDMTDFDHQRKTQSNNMKSYASITKQMKTSVGKFGSQSKNNHGDLQAKFRNITSANKNNKENINSLIKTSNRKADKINNDYTKMISYQHKIQEKQFPIPIVISRKHRPHIKNNAILTKKQVKLGKQNSKVKAKKHRNMWKKKHMFDKFQIKNDVSFERMLVSQKARQLYLHLIHDTRKAFLIRKNRMEKRRRKHSKRMKSHEKSNNINIHVKIYHRKANEKPDRQKAVSKYNIAMKKNNKIHEKIQHGHHFDLAHRILNTMTENDKNIAHEAFLAHSNINLNQKENSKSLSKLRLLDSKSSLLGKLAELKYNAEIKPEMLVSSRRLEDSAVITKEIDNENPGKTIQEEQKNIGLAENVDMDRLDGEKEKYEYKVLDGKIEGELVKNDNDKKNNEQSDIGQLSVKQTKNLLKNLTESETPNSKANNMLNVYNEEESLKNSDFENEEDDDITDSMYLQSLHNQLYENEALKYGAKSKLEEMNLKQKFNHMYFLGNRSSWRNHPIVSMDISPLIKQFYIVNHKNLTELAANRIEANSNYDDIKLRLLEDKMKWKKESKAQANKTKHEKKTSKHHNKKQLHKKKIHEKVKDKKGSRIDASLRSELNSSEEIKHSNKPEVPTIKNNMPKNVNYYMIEDAKKSGAVCIDGSNPGYYYRNGYGSGINKWIIHLHGGAWCYNLETCHRRSLSLLGSTRHWSAENITFFFQGILSDKIEVNPQFYNWNIVVQTYCDGGLFSGKRKEPLIYKGKRMYFRGRIILKAMIHSLNRRNLHEATDILLSGTSAGGLAVILQGEYLKRKLPKNSNVHALIDAGFFVDAEGENWFNIVKDQFKGLYAIHQPKLKLKCEKTKENIDKFKCLFPQYFLNFIEKLPVFIVNSLYDHWQLSELQGLHCVYNNDKCTPMERNQILEFRNVMLSTLSKTLHKMKTVGIFANSCIAHGQAIVDYTWSRAKVNNKTIAESFNDWLKDNKGNRKHIDIDCRYPCNGSCPKPMVNLCVKNFKGATIKSRTKRYAEPLC